VTATEIRPAATALDIPRRTTPLKDGLRPYAKRARRELRLVRARLRLWLKMAVKLMLVYSWRGAWRVTRRLSRWVYDYDSAAVRHHHATGFAIPETKEYVAAQRERRANLRARWIVIMTLALPLLFPLLAWFVPTYLAWLVALLVFIWVCKLIPGKDIQEYFIAAAIAGAAGWAGMVFYPRIPQPDWASPITIAGLAGLGIGALLALGFVGRNADKPILKNTTLGENILPKPTAPMITAALCALGNSKMKEPDLIGLIIDGVRNGPGWNFHFLLPQGVTASWVMERREELAGSMRFPMGCVWPSVGTRNPAHLVLDITDEDLKDADQDPWPLLRAERVDLSKPQPTGTNQKGDWVTVSLAYASAIIGAVPRVGKTFWLRQLLITAGLDPNARVYAIDGKGTGDLSPCALFAHRYLRGVRSTRPELIEKVRSMVSELRHEMDRRADIIDSLSHEECPESKVTGDLIKTRPDLKLGWIVVGIDETQMIFGYGDKANKEHKAIRDELRAGITELVKLGPALGIIVILATQDVVEETIPNQISRMAVIRMCMKVEDYLPNDRILGAGSHKRGITGAMFSQEDIGIGWLKSEGATPQIVRTVWGLDKPACEPLAARGRALRIAAGTLTGDAAGEEMAEEERQIDMLIDCREVMDNPPVPTMHLETLREALSLLRPGVYGNLDNMALGAMLREAGVPVRTVWSRQLSKDGKGVKRQWLDIAATDDLDPDRDDDEGGGEVIDLTERM
jgi:DNA segregation ATPase FtsK/SpoIIIE, S-DNA-T family